MEDFVWKQMLSGQWYDALDESLIKKLRACQQECFEINQMPPSMIEERNRRISKLLGRAGRDPHFNTPLWCDYGCNIEVGDFFFANYNLVILDEAKVTFGDHVFIGPNCSFYTPIHPKNPQERDKGVERAAPITVGNDVWFGGDVTVLPGVSIGDGTTIGAGSVVTKDIPSGVIAVGNPCHVIQTL